eukprot:761578-Pleurochrysis_carterae.AAC.1
MPKDNKGYDTSMWAKYIVLSKVIHSLCIRDKRKVFAILRCHEVDENSFFPLHGFTAGEFAVWNILSENGKRKC